MAGVTDDQSRVLRLLAAGNRVGLGRDIHQESAEDYSAPPDLVESLLAAGWIELDGDRGGSVLFRISDAGRSVLVEEDW